MIPTVRELQLEYLESNIDSDLLAQVENDICEVADVYSATVTAMCNHGSPLIKLLRAKGYTVDVYDDFNEYHLTISWDRHLPDE